jgi:hypothetical protein
VKSPKKELNKKNLSKPNAYCVRQFTPESSTITPCEHQFFSGLQTVAAMVTKG